MKLLTIYYPLIFPVGIVFFLNYFLWVWKNGRILNKRETRKVLKQIEISKNK